MPARAPIHECKLAGHEGLGDGPRRRDATVLREIDRQGANPDAANVRALWRSFARWVMLSWTDNQ